MSKPSPYGSRAPSRMAEKYEVIGKIGEGAYSDVYKCKDRENNRFVIMKKFRESDDDLFVKKTGLREIRSMRSLSHPNIRRLIEVFKRNGKLHFILEFCERTVLDEIEKNRKGVPMPSIKSIIWQTLQGLNHCHLHNFLHRDIKPENILLTKDGVVKLADFGFARSFAPGETLTEYVATKWYRAPELLVGDRQYGPKVDVWATGCIFAELVRGLPLWPGKSDLDQLFLIRKNLGDLIPRHMQIFMSNEFFLGSSIPNPGTIEPLERKFPKELAGTEVMDFLKRCVDKDPGLRSTCEQLLGHPFFKGFTYKYPKDSEYETASIVNSGTLLPKLPGSNPGSSGQKSIHSTNYAHLPTI